MDATTFNIVLSKGDADEVTVALNTLTLQALRCEVRQQFSLNPPHYALSYEDDEDEEVQLRSDDELLEAHCIAEEIGAPLVVRVTLTALGEQREALKARREAAREAQLKARAEKIRAQEEKKKEQEQKKKEHEEKKKEQEEKKKEQAEKKKEQAEKKKEQEEKKKEQAEAKKELQAEAAKEEAVFRAPMLVHHATCDVCSRYISGVRYKCLQCPDYDLCAACEDKNGAEGQVHDRSHVFMKLHRQLPFLGRFPLLACSPYDGRRALLACKQSPATAATAAEPSAAEGAESTPVSLRDAMMRRHAHHPPSRALLRAMRCPAVCNATAACPMSARLDRVEKRVQAMEEAMGVEENTATATADVQSPVDASPAKKETKEAERASEVAEQKKHECKATKVKKECKAQKSSEAQPDAAAILKELGFDHEMTKRALALGRTVQNAATLLLSNPDLLKKHM